MSSFMLFIVGLYRIRWQVNGCTGSASWDVVGVPRRKSAFCSRQTLVLASVTTRFDVTSVGLHSRLVTDLVGGGYLHVDESNLIRTTTSRQMADIEERMSLIVVRSLGLSLVREELCFIADDCVLCAGPKGRGSCYSK